MRGWNQPSGRLLSHHMRNGTPHISSLKRTLAMLEAVIADGGHGSIAALAREIGMPVATAHRQVATLAAEEYLRPLHNGRYVAGRRLLGLLGMLGHLDERLVITNVAAPVLHRLAHEVGAIAQLGTFDSDMVTYRIKTGNDASGLFTRVGMQLEAYCSGMGKVLLANLPEGELAAYLTGGPFVPLTKQTITDPEVLGEELAHVREQDFATDIGEVAEGLFCMAVPIREPGGRVMAAISLTQSTQDAGSQPGRNLLPALREAAQEIETAAFD